MRAETVDPVGLVTTEVVATVQYDAQGACITDGQPSFGEHHLSQSGWYISHTYTPQAGLTDGLYPCAGSIYSGDGYTWQNNVFCNTLTEGNVTNPTVVDVQSAYVVGFPDGSANHAVNNYSKGGGCNDLLNWVFSMG